MPGNSQLDVHGSEVMIQVTPYADLSQGSGIQTQHGRIHIAEVVPTDGSDNCDENHQTAEIAGLWYPIYDIRMDAGTYPSTRTQHTSVCTGAQFSWEGGMLILTGFPAIRWEGCGMLILTWFIAKEGLSWTSTHAVSVKWNDLVTPDGDLTGVLDKLRPSQFNG